MTKVIANIRLTLLANKAAPSSISGQAFGQYGINIMESRKLSNSRTKNIKEDVYIPTHVTIYSDGSFHVIVKTPSTTTLSKKTTQISKGSPAPKKKLLPAWVPAKEIYHSSLSMRCHEAFYALASKSIARSTIGSAKSMGLRLHLSRFGLRMVAASSMRPHA